MYKVFAPMTFELLLVERKTGQVQFSDNQRQSNKSMRRNNYVMLDRTTIRAMKSI